MTATQSTETLRLSSIGRPGKPIRVLAFAGGGFDTAMQLGVVHALLVSRARAPDIVIGCSAGAVSAVALAEVLQADPPPAGCVCGTRRSNASPLAPSPRPTCLLAPSQTTTRPFVQRVRWYAWLTMAPARGTSSS